MNEAQPAFFARNCDLLCGRNFKLDRADDQLAFGIIDLIFANKLVVYPLIIVFITALTKVSTRRRKKIDLTNPVF